ncbi:hypothetical protein [Alsobacter sp. SYSU BS001988]
MAHPHMAAGSACVVLVTAALGIGSVGAHADQNAFRCQLSLSDETDLSTSTCLYLTVDETDWDEYGAAPRIDLYEPEIE